MDKLKSERKKNAILDRVENRRRKKKSGDENKAYKILSSANSDRQVLK